MTTGSTTKAGRRSGGGWTTDRMTDQQGRTFVVTGATSGLGLVTARELAARGARVLLAVRDAARGDEVASSLRSAYPGADVEVRQVDLLNLRSIRRAAEEIDEEEAVDVLINNAGISMVEHSVTEQGAERHLAANHLGHFALTALLEPALRRSPAPRVVTVTSYMHEKGELDLEDVAWRQGTHLWPPIRHRSWPTRSSGGARPAGAVVLGADHQRPRAPGLQQHADAEEGQRGHRDRHARLRQALRAEPGDGSPAPALRCDRARSRGRLVRRP